MITVSDVYEFIDYGNRTDENCLVVDFNFTNEVSKKEAIEMVDKMVSMLDDSTDATAKEFVSHKPTLFAVSQFKEVNDE